MDSPLGSYVFDQTLTGQATFGFVSVYNAGSKTPTVKTDIVFYVADLNFHSTSYDWLVVVVSATVSSIRC